MFITPTMTKKKDFKTIALSQIECVRVYAKGKGFSDQWIADCTGLSRPNVSRIFCGKHIPRLDTFIKICEAVGMVWGDMCKNK